MYKIQNYFKEGHMYKKKFLRTVCTLVFILALFGCNSNDDNSMTTPSINRSECL